MLIITEETKEKIEKIDYFLSRLELFHNEILQNDDRGIDRRVVQLKNLIFGAVEEVVSYRHLRNYTDCLKTANITELKNNPLVNMEIELFEEKICACFSQIQNIKEEEKQLDFFASYVRKGLKEELERKNKKERVTIIALDKRYSTISLLISNYQLIIRIFIESVEQEVKEKLDQHIRLLGLSFPQVNKVSWWSEEFENFWFEALKLSLPEKTLYFRVENFSLLEDALERARGPLWQEEENNYSSFLECSYKQKSIIDWFSDEIFFLKKLYPIKVNKIIALPLHWQKTRQYFLFRLKNLKNSLEVTRNIFIMSKIRKDGIKLQEIINLQRNNFREKNQRIITQREKTIARIEAMSNVESWTANDKVESLKQAYKETEKEILENKEKEKKREEEIRVYQENLENRERAVMQLKKEKTDRFSREINTETNVFAFCYYFGICGLLSGVGGFMFLAFWLTFNRLFF